jgi:hypothetical protein
MVQKSGHESACGKMCKDMTQLYDVPIVNLMGDLPMWPFQNDYNNPWDIHISYMITNKLTLQPITPPTKISLFPTSIKHPKLWWDFEY